MDRSGATHPTNATERYSLEAGCYVALGIVDERTDRVGGHFEVELLKYLPERGSSAHTRGPRSGLALEVRSFPRASVLPTLRIDQPRPEHHVQVEPAEPLGG